MHKRHSLIVKIIKFITPLIHLIHAYINNIIKFDTSTHILTQAHSAVSVTIVNPW